MLTSPKFQSNQGSFWSITRGIPPPHSAPLGLLPAVLTVFVRSEEGIEDWWVQGLHELGLYH